MLFSGTGSHDSPPSTSTHIITVTACSSRLSDIPRPSPSTISQQFPLSTDNIQSRVLISMRLEWPRQRAILLFLLFLIARQDRGWIGLSDDTVGAGTSVRDDDRKQIMDICRDTMPERRNGYCMLRSFKLARFLLFLIHPLPTASPSEGLGETERLPEANMLCLLLFALVSQLAFSASSPTSKGPRVGPAERSWLGGYASSLSRKSHNPLFARGSVPSGWTCVVIFLWS